MPYFNNRFTDKVDCIFGDGLFAQAQDIKSAKRCIKLRRSNPKCCVSRESSSEEKEKTSKMLSKVFRPHGNRGDFIEGRVIIATNCSAGNRSVVSRATGRHGAQTLELDGFNGPAISFIDQPLSYYRTENLDSKIELNEVLGLVLK